MPARYLLKPFFKFLSSLKFFHYFPNFLGYTPIKEKIKKKCKKIHFNHPKALTSFQSQNGIEKQFMLRGSQTPEGSYQFSKKYGSYYASMAAAGKSQTPEGSYQFSKSVDLFAETQRANQSQSQTPEGSYQFSKSYCF